MTRRTTLGLALLIAIAAFGWFFLTRTPDRRIGRRAGKKRGGAGLRPWHGRGADCI